MNRKHEGGVIEIAAPNASLMVGLNDCSTCGHTKVTATWDNKALTGPTAGFVEVILQPICFVDDTTVEGEPLAGTATAEGNVMNCGSVVSYNGLVTNMTDATLLDLTIDLDCPRP